MDKISFKSSICMTSPQKLGYRLNKLGAKYFVNSPWTVEESIVSNINAATLGVKDCTAFGITDRKKTLLIHRCPTVSVNQPFKQFADLIDKIFPMKKNLNAIAVGSQLHNCMSPCSPYFFDEFVKYAEKHDIPCTQLKGVFQPIDIMHTVDTDEWLISSSMVKPRLLFNCKYDPKRAFDFIFEDVVKAPCDEFMVK